MLGPADGPQAAAPHDRHGVTLVDDYAWLKADNWQEVLRDPAVCRTTSGRCWPPRTTMPTRCSPRRRSCRRSSSRKCAGGSRRTMPTCPPRTDLSTITRVIAKAASIDLLPQAARRRRRRRAARRRLAGRGKSFFDLGAAPHSPDHGSSPGAPTKRARNSTPCAFAISRPDATADALAETTGDARLERRFAALLLCAATTNHRPHRVFRHRLGDDPSDDGWSSRSTIRAGSSASRPRRSRDASPSSTSATTIRARAHLIDLRDPAAPPRLVAARERGCATTSNIMATGSIVRTNADGAEDFKIVEAPLADPGARIGSDIVPHRPGRLILAHGRSSRLSRAARARGRIAAHRRPRACERRRACDRLRRGGLFAAVRANGYEFDTALLRFSYSSMTTPEEIFDYDMATRDARLAQAPGDPVGPRPRPLRDPPHFAPARRRRKGAGLAALSQATNARRHGAAAALRLRRLWSCDPGVLQRQSPVAGRSRLRLCHRPCPRRHGQGLALVQGRQARPTSRTRSPISSPRGGISPREGLPRAGRIVAAGGSAGGMLMGAVANLGARPVRRHHRRRARSSTC